jgi:hypothetical protein
MNHSIGVVVLAIVPLMVVLMDRAFAQQAPRPGFFVTSSASGTGDLGGLTGADQRCQALAKTAGVGDRTWRAYLSTTGAGSVNARDRIGAGPWHNVKGALVAQNVAELHSDKANVNADTALDEQGPGAFPGASTTSSISPAGTFVNWKRPSVSDLVSIFGSLEPRL